jgi:hypothetical protein
MLRPFLGVFLVSLAIAEPLAAQAEGCATRVMSRGNPVTGRTLSLSYEYGGISAAQAFASLQGALESVPEELIPRATIHTADPNRGRITGQQMPRGAARPVSLEATVVSLPTGVTQITITNRFPPALFADARMWAQSYCAFLEGLAAGIERGSGGPVVAAPAFPSPSNAMTEDAAVSRGFPTGVIVRGELSSPSERDIYPLTVAAADTFVYDVAIAAARFGVLDEPLEIRIRDAATREDVKGADLQIRGGHAAVSPFVLQPGRYQILVGYGGTKAPTRLRYAMRLSRYRGGVESGTSTLTPGSTFEGRLDYPGDTDILTFRVARGQEIRVRAELLDAWSEHPNVPTQPIYVFGVGEQDSPTTSVMLSPTERSREFTRWHLVEQGGVHRVIVGPWSNVDLTADNPYSGRYRVTVEIRD